MVISAATKPTLAAQLVSSGSTANLPASAACRSRLPKPPAMSPATVMM